MATPDFTLAAYNLFLRPAYLFPFDGQRPRAEQLPAWLCDPEFDAIAVIEVFDNPKQIIEADPEDGPATELLHFALHSPRSPYGVPRWIGNLLSVLGSRQMEEVNYLYFSNKSVPPLALLAAQLATQPLGCAGSISSSENSPPPASAGQGGLFR